MKLFSRYGSKRLVIDNEVSPKVHIPYAFHWKDDTLVTKDKCLIKFIKLDGYSFETADDDNLDIKKEMRNNIFKGISNENIVLNFHLIRKKKDIQNALKNKPIGNYYIDRLNSELEKKRTLKKSFTNELYISVINKPKATGTGVIESVFKKIKNYGTEDEKNKVSEFTEMYEELEEVTHRILAGMKEYNTRMLKIVKKENGGVYSEILGLIYNLINLEELNAPTISNDLICNYIYNNRLIFKNRHMEIIGNESKKYAGMISIKEHSQYTAPGMFDGFLQMPCELIMTQSFSFINRQIAVNKMELQQNRLIQSEDKSISQIAEISKALDDTTSGKIGFGMHHFSVLCIETSLKKLENILSIAETEVTNCGSFPIREKVNLEPSFWGQLPGNIDYLARRSTISTMNLASFVSNHNYPTGNQFNNHWGEAVTIFNTTSGTPFFFNFHLRDVGHTTVIGPTGAGKTVLLNFLCSQCVKYNPRIFFFDKDRGAEIFIRAIGGKYTILESQSNIGFNPMQLENNTENRTFLIDLLKSLITVHDPKMSASDMSKVTDAVSGNFKLDPKDRRLRNIVPFLGKASEDSLAEKIGIWHGSGGYANIFDNVEDTLDLESNNIFGFEMGPLLSDKNTLGPVLLYIFHRISISLDGRPTMIVLDEAWALIDNDVFAPKIKDWLKVLRKLNAFVIFATQSVEDASNSPISETLIQQTATQIFLPNLKATEVYRTKFMLSMREFTLIKTTDPGSRFFLIKQGVRAVIAKLDLSGINELIHILSGRSETVALLDSIRQKVGDEPYTWVDLFLEYVENEQ